nr:hypothetical protein [Tanacetum cinerariifolium]
MRNLSYFIITLTWSKNLMMGQTLSAEIGDANNHCLCKVEIKPWLFSKRRGFKNLEVGSKFIDIYWDLSYAKFGSSPEPIEGFYFAIANAQFILLHYHSYLVNYTILVDGLPVEVYWDIHSWLFEKLMGNAVFLFKSCLSADKLWASEDQSWSSKDRHSQASGFSLVLCAWKNE